MIVNKQQSIISLLWRSACGFSKFSKRQTTPKILRDHRFTRKGMVLGKQSKNYDYDLTNLAASQAHQAHLFFNKEEDFALLKKQADEKEKNMKNMHVFEDHSVPETILLEVQDKFLVQKHPQKVLNNLVELDKQFAKKGGEINQLIQSALNKLIKEQILSFSLKNFGVLTTLAKKYLPNDAKLWENLANNYCRLMQKSEYNDLKTLDSARSQKYIENSVLTLTTVLKFSNRFHLENCVENISQVATSYLSSNFDVVQDVNTRFLLISNILPLIPSYKQVELIGLVKQKMDLIPKLQANTITALTHSIYKVKQQNSKNSRFPADLIDVSFLQKLEQTWLKTFDKSNTQLLAIFSYSLASLGYSGETKKFTQDYVEKNIKDITNLKDLAFFGESLKKFRSLSQKYFTGAEQTLKQALSNNAKELHSELALQFLRIYSKNLFLNSEIVSALIKKVDDAFYYEQFKPKASQNEMIVKTLQKYSQIVDLSNLRIYQNLIGSKKLF
ncbi:hypothetical protein ABPG72_006544 [Tetrahymena utriculariae]